MTLSYCTFANLVLNATQQKNKQTIYKYYLSIFGHENSILFFASCSINSTLHHLALNRLQRKACQWYLSKLLASEESIWWPLGLMLWARRPATGSNSQMNDYLSYFAVINRRNYFQVVTIWTSQNCPTLYLTWIDKRVLFALRTVSSVWICAWLTMEEFLRENVL